MHPEGNLMRLTRFTWGVVGVLGMGPAQGAGFALIEQNASGLGNAYAGQAASAQDASTVFFNPAGLTRIEGGQAVVAGHLIAPSAEFSGSGASSGPIPAPPAGQGGDAGEPAFVPNAYLAMDLTPDLKLGLGLNAPFGLATEYDPPWAGQSHSVRSDLKTYNINPSLAWKISEGLSLGLGLNWQRIEATLSSVHPVAGTPLTMKGDDDSWGWNAGVLWQMTDTTRVGLAYRSQVEHVLEGTLAPAGIPITAAVTLPDTVSLSVFSHLSPAWDVLADITRTGWKSFDELRVLPAAGGAPLSLVTENWENAWRYSLGFNYHTGRNLTWRFGVAYDEAPVPDAAHRTPRIPDADRAWLALGVQYRVSPRSTLDFGYAHLFVDDAPISHCEPEATCPAAGVTLTGTFDNHVDILSFQYTHNF